MSTDNKDRTFTLDGAFREVADLITRGQSRTDATLHAVITRLDTMDTRFDGFDTRFDAVDTRFDGIDTRFDAVDTKIRRLEGVVTDNTARLGRLESQMGRMERASERTNNRVDARLERLIGLIIRDETKRK